MTDIVVPTEQEGTKAVVKTWLKKIGDAVRADDPVVELETDKVAVEIAATSAGVLSEVLVEEGAEVEPGTVLGRIADGAAASVDKAMAQAAGIAPAKPAAAMPSASTLLPPGIRRMLEQHGLTEARRARQRREADARGYRGRSRAPRESAAPSASRACRTIPCASGSRSILRIPSPSRRMSRPCSKPISAPSPRIAPRTRRRSRATART